MACDACSQYDIEAAIGQLSVCEPCYSALVGFPFSAAYRVNAVPLLASDDAALRRMFPLIPADTKLFAVVPRRWSAKQPVSIDQKTMNVYFQTNNVANRPLTVVRLVTRQDTNTIAYFRQTVLKRLSFARNALLFKDLKHTTQRSRIDGNDYTVLSLPRSEVAADMLATLRGHLTTIRSRLAAPSYALRAELDRARMMWRAADRYPLRSDVPFDAGLLAVLSVVDRLLAWQTTQFHEQMPHRTRIGVTRCGTWIAVHLRNIHDISRTFLSAESVLLVFMHEVAHNVSPTARIERGKCRVRDSHGTSFYAAYQMLFIVALDARIISDAHKTISFRPYAIRKLAHKTHAASVGDVDALYSAAESATDADEDEDESNDADADADEEDVPPPKRRVPDDGPATAPAAAPSALPAPPAPVLAPPIPAASASSPPTLPIPAASPPPPAPLPPVSDEPVARTLPVSDEPVARTLVQIGGIGPKAATALGFDVYRLLSVGDNEPAMRALLAPAYVGRPDELAVVVRNALAWVRNNAPRVAAWRDANPMRTLPDLAHPSGWLQDVPGINPNLLNAAAVAQRRGVGTLPQLHAYWRANGRDKTRQLLVDLGYQQGKTSDLDAALDYLATYDRTIHSVDSA